MKRLLRTPRRWIGFFWFAACTPSGTPAVTASHATPPPAAAGSAVRVDQYGYPQGAPRWATWVSPREEPAAWALIDAAGSELLRGATAALALDPESGLATHQVDFSGAAPPGRGYRLRVGEDTSAPFAIASAQELYAPLYVDATRYFYLNRSGEPIVLPHAGRASLARPAGHVSDASVPCLPGSGCSYALDAHGGWYDAGDYGKYAVNGGLATWLLLSTFELASRRGRSDWLADGQLGIPESGNGVPDVLDEARVELEFLMRLQVPSGPLAGMVHHKLHDASWSPMGQRPPTETDRPRYLHPPSTAGTLNLAAVAAQAARVYGPTDPAFSQRCLAVARSAFAAAQAHPERVAPQDSHSGGGPYGDPHLDDDFYWAAAELYATTGEVEYGGLVRRSPFFGGARVDSAEDVTSFDWAATGLLGSMTLLLHPQRLSESELRQLAAPLVAQAQGYLTWISQQAFRFPGHVTEDGHYNWGSNSFIVDNAIVLAFAHHWTGDRRYLDGAQEAVHFLLGRNANDRSYVSGYGERSLQNPHHRFWAHSLAPDLPLPPPGALAGGPNSRLQDPRMRASKQGCRPQTCYLDEVAAFSVNEVAINWNGGLSWLSGYLAMQP